MFTNTKNVYKYKVSHPHDDPLTSVSFPGEGPIEIGQAVLAPALASLAPVVLAISGAVTVTVGGDLLVAKVTEQMPVEGLSERG